jgi:serine/threonine-protein kinase
LSSAPAFRFSYVLPKDQAFTRSGRHILALSPDGSNLVFVSNQQLYRKPMSDLEAKPIPGTMQDVDTPFFSPDGNWIGFYAEGKLKKIAINGGASVDIAAIDNPYGATWYSQDSILVGQGSKGIIRVPAGGGGKPETVIPAKENEVLQTPQVLPGADEVLFTVAGTSAGNRWDTAQIVVQSLKTRERKTLFTGGSDARYVPTGHIVYALGGNLFAYAFDARKLKLTNGPISILQGVRSSAPTPSATFFSFSNNGYLAYVPGNSLSSSDTLLALIDRAGTPKPLPLMPGKYSAPRISPDGTQAAIEVDDGKEVFIGIYNLSGTQAMRRLTLGNAHNTNPLWTQDGQWIIFQSDDGALFWQRADGNGPAERLTTPPKGVLHFADAASPKGNVVTVTAGGAGGGIWALSLDDRKLKQIIPKPPMGTVSTSVFSPNGRWLAYSLINAKNGPVQIYVQPFPPTGPRFQIPQTGNVYPLWSPDGKQIVYLSREAGRLRLKSVDVHTQPSVEFGKPVSLPIEIPFPRSQGRPYDIYGSQFISMLPPDEAQSGDRPSSQINTVLNWFSELKKLVPVK